MGAWLDTLRFRRELATSLGVRRQRVGGFVAGAHGEGLVPLWSTVRVRGLDPDERRRATDALRTPSGPSPRTLDAFPAEIVAAQQTLARVGADDMAAAFEAVDAWPPDLRVVARPWLTHQSGAKTAAGTAAATVDLVEVVLDGRDIVVAGQVALEGETALEGRPVHGVLGVPVVLGPEGWTHVLLDPLAPDEERLLAASARAIDAMVAGTLVPPGHAPDVSSPAVQR